MTVFADWVHRLNEIPSGGLRLRRSASEAERARLATLLSLVSCEALEAEYQIKPAGRDRYALTGRVWAEVSQACVVTLDSITAKLDESLDCKFVSPALVDEDQDEEQEVLSIEDLEPIEAGCIDVGRVVFEVVASGLDPYPRKADAQWQPSEEQLSEGQAGPFAALADLKKKN